MYNSSLMKSLITASAAALALLWTPSVSVAQTLNDRVRVEVRVQSSSERSSKEKETPGAPPDTITSQKKLEIAISGKPKTPETRTGKWTIFGKDVNSRETSVLGSGDFAIELPVNGQQEVVSNTITTTAPLTRAPRAPRSRDGKKEEKNEKAEVKYYGYSVVVKEGDTVVGEYYDPASLKTQK